MYHLCANRNAMSHAMGSFKTLAEAVATAPRVGEPRKTGNHEWCFLPEPTDETIVIAFDPTPGEPDQ